MTINQFAQNLVWASPAGATGAPAMRGLVVADIPSGLPYDASGAAAAAVSSAASAAAGIYVSYAGAQSLTSGQQAQARANIGAGTGSGAGTVTSVALSAPAIFGVTGSPVTGGGTLAFAFNSLLANTVLAGPTSGGATTTPTFRALVAADIPSLSSVYLPVGGAAVSAAKWTTARNLGLTGDGTATLTVDGSANASSALTLATVNTGVGSFGTAAAVATFTVNAKGLITAAGQTTISLPVSQITGWGSLAASIIPTTDKTYNLGAATDRWTVVYAGAAIIDNGSGGSYPSIPAGTNFLVTNADTTATKSAISAFGAEPTLSTLYAGGTRAAPTAPTSATTMGGFNFWGYNSSYQNSAAISAVTTEAWSSGHQGTKLQFSITPTGSTTLTPALIVDQDGGTKPAFDNSYTLGSTSERWATVYTQEMEILGAAEGLLAMSDLSAGTNLKRICLASYNGNLYIQSQTDAGAFQANWAEFGPGFILLTPSLVANLPASPAQGMRAFATDVVTATFGAVVAGGGANAIPVYYDGANWRAG